MDAAGNYKQGADQGDEAEVFMGGVTHPQGGVQAQKIIDDHNERQQADELGIMPPPPLRNEQWGEGNGRQ